MLEAMECASESMELFGRSRMPDTVEQILNIRKQKRRSARMLTRCARDAREGSCDVWLAVEGKCRDGALLILLSVFTWRLGFRHSISLFVC